MPQPDAAILDSTLSCPSDFLGAVAYGILCTMSMYAAIHLTPWHKLGIVCDVCYRGARRL